MDECPNMQRIAEVLEAGTDLREAGEAVRHLHDCPTCREQLARMNWLAVSLGELPRPADDGAAEPHPEELQIAAFSVHGAPGWQVDVIEAHVADCDECLAVVASVRRRLEEAEEILGVRVVAPPPGTWSRGLRDAVAAALSSPARAAAFVGACVAYVAGCVSVALGLAHLIGWWVLGPIMPRTITDAWPLCYVPDGPLRLVALLFICVALALLARLLAGRLCRRAIGSQGNPNEDGEWR